MKSLREIPGDLTPQARAVLRAFADARGRAAGFVLSSGIFPELNESGSEKIHDVVRDIAARHLSQARLDRALRAALARGARSAESRDEIEAALNALLTSEGTAAYIVGLAAGLTVSSLDEALKP